MITITFGTATITLHPSITSRDDVGVSTQQYAIPDLCAAVRAVVQAAGTDHITFANYLRSMP